MLRKSELLTAIVTGLVFGILAYYVGIGRYDCECTITCADKSAVEADSGERVSSA